MTKTEFSKNIFVYGQSVEAGVWNVILSLLVLSDLNEYTIISHTIPLLFSECVWQI